MEDWQRIQAQNIRTFDELRLHIPLPNSLSPFPKFPLNIPRRLVEKMEPGDFTDPLFLQFVPLSAELVATPGFTADAVGDATAAQTQKLLHKYHGRALLLVSSACAMHCRYCFRQKFPYEKALSGYEEELEYLKNTPSITEVILSGGDPLSLPDPTLTRLLRALDAIPHISLVRFHTRFPVGIPERISTTFVESLASLRTQVIFVVHVNHAQELDDEVFAALKRVQTVGIPVMTQSVLLRGINDSVHALKQLCMLLVRHGIIPYYLHQLDRVQNTAHFEVDPEEGIQLINALRKGVPGYAVPQYVQEIAGVPSKTPLHSLECLQPEQV